MDIENFDKLKQKLLEVEQWPLRYMFKFIVPNQDGNVDAVKALMPTNGKLSFKHTSNLKHVSITCVAEMQLADQIIEITYKATSIKGVIAL